MMIDEGNLTPKLILGLTASMILIIEESVSKYGMYGGFIFSLSLSLAYGLYLLISHKPISSFPLNNRITNIWVFLAKAELFILEGFTFTIIIMILFGISQMYSFLFFILSAFIMVLFLKSGSMIKFIQFFDVPIFFTIAIFLSIFSNLQKGIETNYHNLLYYHPRILFIHQEGSFSIFIFITLSFLSKMILINNKEKVEKKKLGIFTFASSTAFIAISIFAIVSITEQVQTFTLNTRLFLVSQKILPELGYIIFIILMIILIFTSLYLSVFYRKQILISNKVRIYLFYSMILFLFIYWKITIFQIYLIFGSLHMIIAVLSILEIIYKKQINGKLS